MNTQDKTTINSLNSQINELARKYDSVKIERGRLMMQGQDTFSLYLEMQELENEIEALYKKRDSLMLVENPL